MRTRFGDGSKFAWMNGMDRMMGVKGDFLDLRTIGRKQGLIKAGFRPAHGEPVEPLERPSTGSGRAENQVGYDFEKALREEG